MTRQRFRQQARQPTPTFLAAAIVLLCGLVIGGCRRPPPEQPPRRPNILFILLDDLRWNALGYAGHPYVKTPNIDRIAREGVNFRNAFCTTSLCSPSRASLLSGLYAHKHGVTNNFTEYPEQFHPLSQRASRRRVHDGLRRQVPHGRGQRRAAAGVRLLRDPQGPGQVFRHRVQHQRRAARGQERLLHDGRHRHRRSTGCSAITAASRG